MEKHQHFLYKKHRNGSFVLLLSAKLPVEKYFEQLKYGKQKYANKLRQKICTTGWLWCRRASGVSGR